MKLLVKRVLQFISKKKADLALIPVQLFENYPFLNFRKEQVINLINHCNAHFYDCEGNLFVEIEGLKFWLTNRSDLYVLHEVFVNKMYEFNLPDSIDAINIIDIGANVGITSMFFASKKKVKKVFSYEPFKSTYNQFIKNIELNSSFSDKIVPNQFGLGLNNREIKVPFSESAKGLSSIDAEWSKVKQLRDVQLEQVQIKETHKVFEKILFLDKDPIFWMLKVDCEGAEYEIFKSLEKKNDLIRKISMIIMEWHGGDPEVITTFLSENGFVCTLNRFENLNAGSIIAFNSNAYQ